MSGRKNEGSTLAILAVQAIRKMRGGSQSQLMLGDDSNLWIVKFQNNPQHLHILANEMLGTRLAAAVGLTVPTTDVVAVSQTLVDHTSDMLFELGQGHRERYAAGLQFGSKFVGGLMPGASVDYLPDQQLTEVSNPEEFAGILAFDKWTCNCDGRQAVFTRRLRQGKYTATFIDQGFCFNAGEWTFPDAPLRGIYARNRVYSRVTGWDSFQPWLHRIEEMSPETLWEIAETVPLEWYGGNTAAIKRLLATLRQRSERVRELITSFRRSEREPFPNWV